MYCCTCNKHISECTCPDIEERLKSLQSASHVLTRWCKTCGKHADRCGCADGPSTELKSGGRVVSATELKPLVQTEWVKCPTCGASWKASEPGIRAMVDCYCDAVPVAAEKPEEPADE